MSSQTHTVWLWVRTKSKIWLNKMVAYKWRVRGTENKRCQTDGEATGIALDVHVTGQHMAEIRIWDRKKAYRDKAKDQREEKRREEKDRYTCRLSAHLHTEILTVFAVCVRLCIVTPALCKRWHHWRGCWVAVQCSGRKTALEGVFCGCNLHLHFSNAFIFDYCN